MTATPVIPGRRGYPTYQGMYIWSVIDIKTYMPWRLKDAKTLEKVGSAFASSLCNATKPCCLDSDCYGMICRREECSFLRNSFGVP